MKSIVLAFAGLALGLSSFQSAAAACACKGCGWLVNEKTLKSANKQQCEMNNALYEFATKKFGQPAGYEPEVISASRKGFAVKGADGKPKNPYSKEVAAFLKSVRLDAGKPAKKRRYDMKALTAGFRELSSVGKIPQDVSFRFDAARGVPVLVSAYRTDFKFSSLESGPVEPQCFNGIDVTGLALGGDMGACPAPQPLKAEKKRRS